jgi:hypothetical protein
MLCFIDVYLLLYGKSLYELIYQVPRAGSETLFSAVSVAKGKLFLPKRKMPCTGQG